MNRGFALLVVAFVLVAVAGIAVAGPVGTVVAQDDPATTNETGEPGETQPANETDISPGELFSGVIGVQRAEIAGEIESRAFEVGLNRTSSPEERASLVAERLNRTEERLAAVERQQKELRERREAGELSPGGFAARMAETSARAETIKREANRSADVAEELPESVRAERGLTRERLGELRERAGNASGPEVAAIARGIGGNDVGGPLASDRRGPPAGAGGGPGAGEGPGAGNGSGSEGGPGAGNGPGNGSAGEGSGPENGPGAGEGPPERGNGTAGPPERGNGTTEGPPEGGNGTAGNSTTGGDDAANGVRGPNQPGNATDDRGANASDDRGPTEPDDRPGGNGSGEGAGSSSSSSAADENRGNSSDAGDDAANAVGPATNRFVEPLIDGVDTIRRILAGVRG